MPVLDDIRTEVSSYASDFVTLEIINVQSPGALNVGDEASFQVRIRNNGHMDVEKLRLHLEGSPYGTVGLTSGGPYSSSQFPPEVDVAAHATRTVGPYYFLANQRTDNIAGTQNLWSGHVSYFDVNWDHVMKDHTGHSSPPNGTYSGEIFPS